jgi:hypothetical protein
MYLNLSTTDRIFRIIIGLVLISLTFMGPKTPWGYLGLIAIFTGMVGYCPIYGMFGFSTRRNLKH